MAVGDKGFRKNTPRPAAISKAGKDFKGRFTPRPDPDRAMPKDGPRKGRTPTVMERSKKPLGGMYED